MHGFFGSYGKAYDWDLSKWSDRLYVKRSYAEGSLHLTQVTLPKFMDDKCFVEVDECFLAVEGVLFEADSAKEAIARYRRGETLFWDSWRGSFCGVLYDKRADRLLLFNDHIGSKMLFYAQQDGGLVFSSDLLTLSRVTDIRQMDEPFVEDMLATGYTSGSHTFVKGIHRLLAGEYLLWDGNELTVSAYHRFDNTPWEYNESEMIQTTDRLFRQAVERVIQKNEQAGLRHYFPLSGGLDSRMTQWIARQMTSAPIVNYTYSQSGHYDHLLPQEISKALGNRWEFVPLDGGAYLTDIDQVTTDTEWLINYMGPIEIDMFVHKKEWQNVGVVLTGVNGDNILNSETDNKHEMARIRGNGFNGNSLGSPLVLQHVTESYSPFTDVDLLDYVLHVPTSIRTNYTFYDKWILRCYPEAAQWHHKFEQIGKRHKMVTIASRNIRVVDVPKRIVMTVLKRLHIYDAYRAEKGVSMTPYDTWVQENEHILSALQAYYDAHIHYMTNSAILAVCQQKMAKGSMMEKGKVLTILSALEGFADNG